MASISLTVPDCVQCHKCRSAQIAVADGRIHLWVGGGIVWDSDPAAEIEESWVKARPLLDAIGAPLGEVVPA